MALMQPPYQFLAHQLHEAMSGAGTDEDTLFETLCTHTNAEINGIKAAYASSKRQTRRGGGRRYDSEKSILEMSVVHELFWYSKSTK